MILIHKLPQGSLRFPGSDDLRFGRGKAPVLKKGFLNGNSNLYGPDGATGVRCWAGFQRAAVPCWFSVSTAQESKKRFFGFEVGVLDFSSFSWVFRTVESRFQRRSSAGKCWRPPWLHSKERLGFLACDCQGFCWFLRITGSLLGAKNCEINARSWTPEVPSTRLRPKSLRFGKRMR